MSLFDDLKKQVASVLGLPEGTDPATALHAGALDGIVEMVKSHGLGGLLEKFKSKGLGDVFHSWVGTGANLPISPEQIKSVFDPAVLEKLAQRLGLPEGKVTALLAQILPGIVDKMTPNGLIEGAPAPE